MENVNTALLGGILLVVGFGLRTIIKNQQDQIRILHSIDNRTNS